MNVTPLPIAPLDDGVVGLRVCSDDNPHIDREFVSRFVAAAQCIKADETVRVVILEGGTQYFSAGGSRDDLVRTDVRLWNEFYQLSYVLLSLPVPAVAAMAGHAIGGGLLLGLWCDVAVFAEESLYGANFMALGFTPGMGSTVALEEWFGAPLARELLFTGRLMKGRDLRAAAGSLLHAVVPRQQVRSRALAIAREMAGVPREALMLLKQMLSERRRERLGRALKEEEACQAAVLSSEEAQRRIAERYAVPLETDAEEP